jgi:hypothetical protein
LWRQVDQAGEVTALGYVLAIGATLSISWLVTLKLGGAGVVAPHWFYVPIMLCAYRFGRLPTVAVSLLAGLLTGPVMPDHFSHGVAYPQVTSDWVSRGIDFLVLGYVMALLFRNLRRQRDAARASLRDPLTGLANRVVFLDRLQNALARLERAQGIVGVLFLDLDDFKAVNDHKGTAPAMSCSWLWPTACRPGCARARPWPGCPAMSSP